MELNIEAPAKINLGLDVLRRREDGYHQVRMIMQSIDLCDCIQLVRTKDTQIKVETNLTYLPTNKKNLAYKAAKLLKDEFHIRDGIFIRLEKKIPVAAGMAGGSADAAAVLHGINKMFQLGLTLDELMERGVKLGADVPYCLMGGTALSEGIGELLTPLHSPISCSVLIAKPRVSVSTKFVYEHLCLNEQIKHPNIDQILTDIACADVVQMAGHMGNILESVTIPNYPVIAQIKEAMLELGALNAMMSGSGPTVFGLFKEEETATDAYEAMKNMNLAEQVYLTELLGREMRQKWLQNWN
ncbi:4-(cytidine 5'-diphospho)-2-C-methyl-D-erythritol kinase [Lachnospiraceae bacterium ZAX-1]